jgi:hypothetical protein
MCPEEPQGSRVENPRVSRAELGIFPNSTMHLHVHSISNFHADHNGRRPTQGTTVRTSSEYTPSNHHLHHITRMGKSIMRIGYLS